MLKSELEEAYNHQEKWVQRLKSTQTEHTPFVDRAGFDALIRPTTHIRVITGVRRSGKSTLLHMLMNKTEGKIAYLNFEDSRLYDFTVSDFPKLYEIVGSECNAYFFDEIQNVDVWEIFIRQLHDEGKRVYLTGSNASLLSRELGTRLTGRYLPSELFPFSFTEFLRFKIQEPSVQLWREYTQSGGFPEFLKDGSPEILQNLFKDIVLRDIAVRYGVRNTKALIDLTLFLLSNVGKEHSFNSLRKTFELGSSNTVSDYMDWLQDAYLLFYLPKFSWSLKSTAVNPRKVYAIDTGLILSNTLSFSADSGRLLENQVFLHLRKSGKRLYYFREKKECDFVVFDREKCDAVYQVCAELHSDNKKREIDGLLEAMTFFALEKGFIITENQSDELVVEGKQITLVPAWKWMVG